MIAIDKRMVDGIHILDMSGKLIANSEYVFWDAIQDAVVRDKGRKVLLNFADVAECDSYGISELLRVHRSIDNLRGSMLLYNVNDLIGKVFSITKVDTILTVLPDEDAAMARLHQNTRR